MPATAILSDITVPASYTPGGSWSASGGPSDGALSFWGTYSPSLYPIGAHAVFSFTADNVTVGSTDALLTTFWGSTMPTSVPSYYSGVAYYTNYSANLAGPVAPPVPEPVGLSLVAVSSLGLLRRRMR